MNVEWLYGLAPLTLPGYVAITAAMVQTTIVAVTVYLHRDAAHRSIDLHPALRHFFRCWIWMTSSMLTREWVAVHRKHHAYADRPGDPHSPVQAGLRRILLEGAEFYARESRNPDTQKYYGKGTPADWIERRVYSRHRNAGIVIFVLLDAAARRRLHELLETYPVLRTVHDCQEQLRQLWDTANAGNHNVAGMFKNWCARAEASGIQALANFAVAISELSVVGRRQRSLRTNRHAVCDDVQP